MPGPVLTASEATFLWGGFSLSSALYRWGNWGQERSEREYRGVRLSTLKSFPCTVLDCCYYHRHGQVLCPRHTAGGWGAGWLRPRNRSEWHTVSAPLEVTDGGEWVGPVTWAPGEGGAWSFQSQFSPRQPSRWAEQATMWLLSRVMCCVDALDPSSWEAFWVRAALPITFPFLT